jgi:hypothetical protein
MGRERTGGDFGTGKARQSATFRDALSLGDSRPRLDEPELRHGRADDLGDMRRDEMGVVPLGHTRVGVAKVSRDHRQWCPGLQQVRGIRVAQNMEARWRIDPGVAAGLAQEPMLVEPSSG